MPKIKIKKTTDIKLTVTGPPSIRLRTGAKYVNIGAEEYRGSYEITPATETQVIKTEGKVLTRNIEVGKIPNNYGLITWDGSKLTVS